MHLFIIKFEHFIGKTFHRFLMSRDVDIFNLEGKIFDHACGLDPDILNSYNVLLCNDLNYACT